MFFYQFLITIQITRCGKGISCCYPKKVISHHSRILQYLFHHCLRLAHIPEPWRHITVKFIPNAGKRSYHGAKSFRKNKCFILQYLNCFKFQQRLCVYQYFNPLGRSSRNIMTTMTINGCNYLGARTNRNKMGIYLI